MQQLPNAQVRYGAGRGLGKIWRSRGRPPSPITPSSRFRGKAKEFPACTVKVVGYHFLLVLPKKKAPKTTGKSPSKPKASPSSSSTLSRPSAKAKEKILKAAKGGSARKQAMKGKPDGAKSPRKTPTSDSIKKRPGATASTKRTKDASTEMVHSA